MSPKMIDSYRRNFGSQKPAQTPPDYLPDTSPNYIHREQMHMQPQQIQHMLQYQQQQSVPYNQNLQYSNLMANQRSNNQQSALLSTDSFNQHHQQQSQSQISNVSPGMMSNISHNAFDQNQKALTQQQHNYLNSMATNSISKNSPRASPILLGSNVSGVIDHGQKGMINQLTSQQQANIDVGNPLSYHMNQGKHFDMNVASNRYRVPVPPQQQQQQQYHHQQSRNSPMTNPRFIHSPRSNINNQTRNSLRNNNQYLTPPLVPNNMMGMNQHHSYSSNLIPGDFPMNHGQIPNQGLFSDPTSGENIYNNQGKTKRSIQLQHCDVNTQRLCFPLRQGSVLPPFNLPHDTNQISMPFVLTEAIFEELMWRNDIELQFKCFHHEDKFMRVSWPRGIKIIINDSPVPVNEPSPNNMMPASLPLFIKGVCHKGRNTIDVSVNNCACSHLLYLQIVHRPTILQIMEKVYQSRHVNDSNYGKRLPWFFDSQNHANRSPNLSTSKANLNRNGNLEMFD
ncbi:MAG: Zinc finger MIZ domain-containing protein 1, partial [Marteilia pararefringens]